MALCPLVLLHTVQENFQTSVDAAVVHVEAEPPNLQRFPAAFVLTGVNSGIEGLQDLIVAAEQSFVERFGVPQVNTGFEYAGRDDEALVADREGGELEVR